MTEREMFAAVAAQHEADRRAGGPWRVYLPNPGSRSLRLHWSFATETEAKARIALMVPAIQRQAEVRYEV